jgi:signal transduction histidine kinase
MPASSPFLVLVVDDDGDTRENLRDILELDNYQVEAAETAAEALQRNNWTSISAILLDRKLPDSSAEALLPQLKQLAPEAAIMIVTGYTDLEGAITAIRQGASDYITKPINPDLIRKRLAHFAEKKRAEEEIKRLREQALQNERLAAIGQMMTVLAHESGNALARLQLSLDALGKEVGQRPRALELVARIQDAQDYLQQLYQEVRNYAAPLKLERGRWNLSMIWRQAWDNLAVLRKGRDAELLEATGGIDLRCQVDQFRLEQVFRNIFENSLAACADPVRVQVDCSATEVNGLGALQLAVRDNGPGLSAEQRQRIFDPFFTTKTKGTGLGMAIAKRIVEAHSGEISVGADSSNGAEIRVVLPREGVKP